MSETETGDALLDVARSFWPCIVAERDCIEASYRLSKDLARGLAHAGFFRIFLSEAYGGLDLASMEAMDIFEELARADASVAWCVWNGNTHWTVAQLSPEAVCTIYADPMSLQQTVRTPRVRYRSSRVPREHRLTCSSLRRSAKINTSQVACYTSYPTIPVKVN